MVAASSTGELFRDNINGGPRSPEGEGLASIAATRPRRSDRGHGAGVAAVASRRTRRIVFDGFPRTVAQAERARRVARRVRRKGRRGDPDRAPPRNELAPEADQAPPRAGPHRRHACGHAAGLDVYKEETQPVVATTREKHWCTWSTSRHSRRCCQAAAHGDGRNESRSRTNDETAEDCARPTDVAR